MTVNGIQQDYHAADANIQLANASKKEQANFAKKEIQDTLKSAKNISLFDPNHDGKLGDNEYLVIQGQDDNYSVLYSPKKGTTKDDIVGELDEKYNFDAKDIPDKINHNDFIQIPLKTGAAASKPNEQLANVLKGLLNADKKYSFDVQITYVKGAKMAVLRASDKNATKVQRFFDKTKPSYGYIKEKLGLKDGVLTEYNDIYDCAGRQKPTDYGAAMDGGSNNFDQWTLESDKELYIPVSALYQKQ